VSARSTTHPTGRPLFTPLPIFDLSLRAFSGGKAVRVVALFALVPLLFAGIYALDAGGQTPREFMNDLFLELIAPTILPLAVLTLATNALGNEIEDRTMVYLVLKPIPRWRIVAEKFLAVITAGTLLLWLGTFITWLSVVRGDAGENLDQLVAMELGILAAVLGYGSLFLAVSLLISRALLAGILYALLWETTIARFIPGVRLVSIRHYVVSIYGRILDERAFLVEDAMHLGPSVIVIAILTLMALAVASWRLGTMNLE
jgi:ABC-2 type transport system permease protein